MGLIFLSYRRADSPDMAQLIATWLTARFPGDTVFLDVGSIEPGSDFRAAIETALVQAGIVLIVIGPSWVRARDGRQLLADPADNVRFELEMALRHNKPIIPLLVQGATMPAAADFPAHLSQASFLNALVIRPGPAFNQDMEAVARVKERHMPSGAHTPGGDAAQWAAASRAINSSLGAAYEPFAAILLVISVFFAFAPLFPLAPYFMARSVRSRIGDDPKAATARRLLRASMIISAIALGVQAAVVLLAVLAAIVVVIAGLLRGIHR
jgi:hypothetical protein